jgi:hypothetical protein
LRTTEEGYSATVDNKNWENTRKTEHNFEKNRKQERKRKPCIS